MNWLGLAASTMVLAVASNPATANSIIENPTSDGAQAAETQTWSIALSGGGLRSALYMVGAMRGLEEAGLVSNAETISSVSGGGYASYWLYSRYALHNAGDERFGYYSLSDEEFPKRTCDLITQGNFVTITQSIWSFITGNEVDLYERSIRRSFGNGDQRDEPVFLSQFHEQVEAGLIPSPVVNTTIAIPETLETNGSLLQFRTDGYFGVRYGPSTWAETRSGEVPFYRLAAISGAAIGSLQQWVENPFDEVDGDYLRLWDGGKSENLGAFHLIVSGAPRVLIIDAEHDPEFGFGAYTILRSRLEQEGITLEIPGIEDARGARQNQSYFAGIATSDEFTTDVVYLKMSLPTTLDELLAEQTEPDSVGSDEQRRFMAALENSNPNSRNWDCASLEMTPFQMRQWSAYNAGTYATYLATRDRTARIFNATGIDFLRLDFPQYATPDQSFYVDQSLAYIGLGYLQAGEFVENFHSSE